MTGSTGGVRLLQPFQRTKGERGSWQEGTADALRFNLDVISPAVDDVLILAGDHIYKMDYRPLIDFHHERGAEITLAARPVPQLRGLSLRHVERRHRRQGGGVRREAAPHP